MMLLLAVIGASWFDVDDVPAPSPVVDTRLVEALAEIDRLKAELATIRKAEPKPAVTLVTTDNCSLCGQQAAILDRAGIKYSTRNERLPTNKYTGYPVLEMDGRAPLVGLRQQADVERWMRGGK